MKKKENEFIQTVQRMHGESIKPIMNKRKLESFLKDKYKMVAGEKTLEIFRREIRKLESKTIPLSGRSLVTGRKKTVKISFKELMRSG